ncbi:MAG: hypothetical protein OXE92_11120 [Bacteroidetes bacterium]|nr:hypothetical protein [Bacteroidota bacterium]MCY4206263.1 hypothetical protein [Bacteroidota bacterium]
MKRDELQRDAARLLEEAKLVHKKALKSGDIDIMIDAERMLDRAKEMAERVENLCFPERRN